MPKQYDHAYTIAFSLVSNDPDGADVTNEMLMAAILKRLHDLAVSTQQPGGKCLADACGAPYDTFEVED